MAEAQAVFNKESNSEILRAIGILEKGLVHWRAAQNSLGEAATLYNIGSMYTEIGEEQEALDATSEALRVARSTGDKVSQAWALDLLGAVFTVGATAPGIFNNSGMLTPSARAARGSTVSMYITGDGELSPMIDTGAPPPADTPVSELPKPRASSQFRRTCLQARSQWWSPWAESRVQPPC